MINPGFLSKGTIATLNVDEAGAVPACSRVKADVGKFGS